MSIRDKKCIFGEYALSGGTGYSDVLDLGNAGDAYDALWLVILGTIAGAGGTKIVASLETSDTEAFTTATTLFQTPEILLAALTAATEQARVRLPLGCKQYLRMKYTATGTFTAGKVETYLTPDIDI